MLNIRKRKVLEKPKKMNGMNVFSETEETIFFSPETMDETITTSMNIDNAEISSELVIEEGVQNLNIISIHTTTTSIQNKRYMDRANVCRESGCNLAAEGKMSEAITKWQEGLFFSPNDFLLHELTAQGFLSLDQNILALKSAFRGEKHR